MITMLCYAVIVWPGGKLDLRQREQLYTVQQKYSHDAGDNAKDAQVP